MSKSNKYGYSGVDIPTQAFQANVGKFDPAEINELVQEDKWTQYGQLELIETKTASGDNIVDFTDIKENVYNVHFAIIDVNLSGTSSVQIRFFESGVLETGSVYQNAYQNGQATGTFSETQATTNSRLFATQTGSTDEIRQAYNYFYNLGDSTKYSFQTMQGVSQKTGTTACDMRFGSGIMPQASQVDGIRFTNTASQLLTGSISLYGLRFS
jgi:hypothetical protein